MSLQDAVNAYLDCLLWSTPELDEEGNIGESLDASYDRDDFAPEAIAEATEDVASFYKDAGDLLNDLDDSQVGHDFALTRNGHGAGFWDRGLGEVGDKLTTLCHPYDSTDPYVGDDGKLYLA